MNSPPRVVLDTNVVLSALVFAQGQLADGRRAWQQDRCQPIVSRATVAELLRALAYPKFRLSRDEQRELLADYLPYCATDRVPTPGPVPPCRDPADIVFLKLVIVSRADYLVTGNRDLLDLASAFPTSIITPGRLLDLVKDPRP